MPTPWSTGMQVVKPPPRKHPRERRTVARRSLFHRRLVQSAREPDHGPREPLSLMPRVLSALSEPCEEIEEEQMWGDAETCDNSPKKRLEQMEVQVELYRRKCAKLNVCPVGAYVRNPGSPVLKVNNYCLGPSGALALSVPLTLDSCVTHLYLQGNGIGSEGLRYLAACLQETDNISHLNLADNDLGSEGAAIMGNVLRFNRSLESISLAGNMFRDSDSVHFTEILLDQDKRPLTELDLSRNQLEDGAAIQLGEVLACNERLEMLDLSWNQIRPRGGVKLMHGLKENPTLKRFSVARNGLGDAGCEAAGMALAVNRALVELDVSGNRITNAGLLGLAKSLQTNDTLRVLKLGDNLATGLGAQAIGEAILRTEECAVNVLDLTNINVFDILVEEVKAHAQTHPLSLKHGAISRFVLPRDQLEKKFDQDFRAAHPPPERPPSAPAEVEDEKENKPKSEGKGPAKPKSVKKNAGKKKGSKKK